ncbi:chemoreceptor glutamine deamidase CheD [Aestuariispira insulae]|uniref:Probable chemoreceptor glutamine deamidase CheD n=1 Tax=Aestuariispira insulae TaxID=1461337 RepID=A0A3D9HX40_9PROT|nr:chemoreceptor glutamine deamidase CheD [Aestuariispira insulae]RED54072.1 chemotaxis protein CheD [Aestuariispira insulae]
MDKVTGSRYADDLDPEHPQESPLHSYFDPKLKRTAVKVRPGTHYVTSRQSEVIVTTLGSCISACIRDTAAGIGGMNHFMLPESETGLWGGASAALRYGNHAMEVLINDLLKMGAARNRLEIKLFGGGSVVKSLSDVGERNIKFILRYMKNEHLATAVQHLGGKQARSICYFPDSGRVRMKLLDHSRDNEILADENAFGSKLSERKKSGFGNDAELF